MEVNLISEGYDLSPSVYGSVVIGSDGFVLVTANGELLRLDSRASRIEARATLDAQYEPTSELLDGGSKIYLLVRLKDAKKAPVPYFLAVLDLTTFEFEKYLPLASYTWLWLCEHFHDSVVLLGNTKDEKYKLFSISASDGLSSWEENITGCLTFSSNSSEIFIGTDRNRLVRLNIADGRKHVVSVAGLDAVSDKITSVSCIDHSRLLIGVSDGSDYRGKIYEVTELGTKLVLKFDIRDFVHASIIERSISQRPYCGYDMNRVVHVLYSSRNRTYLAIVGGARMNYATDGACFLFELDDSFQIRSWKVLSEDGGCIGFSSHVDTEESHQILINCQGEIWSVIW